VPELPEVETLSRDLEHLLIGAEFLLIEVLWDGAVEMPDAGELQRQLPGRKVMGVTRRGKFVVMALSGPSNLLIHLRMSGQLHVVSPEVEPDRYARVVFRFTDRRQLIFSDVRKFGRVYWTTDLNDVLGHLGPEPLDDQFTATAFFALCSAHRGAIKPMLLNQRKLAGLGNIYCDEALFLARLHPQRKANSLSRWESDRLHEAIRQVLRQAIDNRGTTLPDERYRDAKGQPGNNAESLLVYQRAGEPCCRCSTPIRRIVVGGRGTHLCPCCQDDAAFNRGGRA
jgi:formamidopyrimidine-DNA glycosylase